MFQNKALYNIFVSLDKLNNSKATPADKFLIFMLNDNIVNLLLDDNNVNLLLNDNIINLLLNDYRINLLLNDYRINLLLNDKVIIFYIFIFPNNFKLLLRHNKITVVGRGDGLSIRQAGGVPSCFCGFWKINGLLLAPQLLVWIHIYS